MVRPQLPIGLLLFEQMIDDDQDAMSQGHNRFLVSHALAQSLVVRTQKGALTACNSVGSFNERLTQPAVAFDRFSAVPVVRTDLDGGPPAHPGPEVHHMLT